MGGAGDLRPGPLVGGIAPIRPSLAISSSVSLIVGCDGFGFLGGSGDAFGTFAGGNGEGVREVGGFGEMPPDSFLALKPVAVRFGAEDFEASVILTPTGGRGGAGFLSVVTLVGCSAGSPGSGDGEPTETTSKGTEISSCST